MTGRNGFILIYYGYYFMDCMNPVLCKVQGKFADFKVRLRSSINRVGNKVTHPTRLSFPINVPGTIDFAIDFDRTTEQSGYSGYNNLQ